MMTCGLSETGGYRKENQDSILIRKHGGSGLFIVADGIGGAEHGELASQHIVSSFERWWEQVFLLKRKLDFDTLFELAKHCAEEINQEICRRYGVRKCGSTIVLLFVHRRRAGWLSAGDSRIYMSSKAGTKQITRDDVWENRPGADLQSVHAGKLTSAVGIFQELEYSCTTMRIHLGDTFLLCSDGIHKYVNDIFLLNRLRHMREALLLRESNLKEIVDRALANDTKDNYSLILVKL